MFSARRTGSRYAISATNHAVQGVAAGSAQAASRPRVSNVRIAADLLKKRAAPLLADRSGRFPTAPSWRSPLRPPSGSRPSFWRVGPLPTFWMIVKIRT